MEQNRDGRASQHSLWLVPAPPLADELTSTIRELAGRYDSVAFTPHITLLGSLATDAARKPDLRRSLAGLPVPLQARFTAVTCGSEYFRRLYLAVALSDDIAAAHQLALQKLYGSHERPFQPHLSLLYADPGRKIDESLLRSIERRYVNRVCPIEKLVLMSTAGPVASWQPRDEISLAKINKRKGC